MPILTSRRDLLRQAALLASLAGGWPALGAASGFTHSVASGDPKQDRVVLWTRYVPPLGGEAELVAEVAEDEGFSRIVARGQARSGPGTDFCAHAIPTGLKPGRWYHYRFRAGSEMSPVGRTRTLPDGPLEQFRIGVFSCANATSGWFTAYGHAAARDDLDLLVHTGDYIYESRLDRSDALPGLAATRGIQPLGEAATLVAYRQRYASYRLDRALQELHRRYPMVVMWDDHETANNSWAGGAANHGPEEGPWEARKAAGIRAFREWLPVDGSHYASYRIGDLATLFRLETRLLGRSRQLDLGALRTAGPDLPAAIRAFRDGPLADPSRTMMGAAQEQWLADAMAASVQSGARWQLVAQQVIMGSARLPRVTGAWFGPDEAAGAKAQAELAVAALLAAQDVPTALDRWDGYPAARRRFLDSAGRAGANLVVLSGDSHNGWAFDLAQDGKPAGVEFAGHSVSSLGMEKRFGGDPAVIADSFLSTNAALRWCDTSQRGYMVTTLRPEAIRNEWLFLPSRQIARAEVTGRKELVVAHGSNRLAG